MRILQDFTEDSEVRIAAYLSLMACPDYKTILSIKDLLMDEEMNQGLIMHIQFCVGSCYISLINSLMSLNVIKLFSRNQQWVLSSGRTYKT